MGSKQKDNKPVKSNGKANWFVRVWKAICNFFTKKVAGFFKGIFSELKKVSWPTRKQVVTNTLSVLAFCLVVGLLIWLSDFAMKELMSLITRLK